MTGWTGGTDYPIRIFYLQSFPHLTFFYLLLNKIYYGGEYLRSDNLTIVKLSISYPHRTDNTIFSVDLTIYMR